MPTDFKSELVSKDTVKKDVKAAKNTQKIDNGIDAQKRVFELSGKTWAQIRDFGLAKKLFSPKEVGVLNVACQIPIKVPSEKQCAILIEALNKVQMEGLKV